MGKTTIAAALLHDKAIRASFEKIVWVSVGQEPDIRELQDSIHHQLTRRHFQDDIKNEADALTAIRDAARGCKILLVLDDVWDPKHEKPLNCIDSDNTSRLIVTTRIRGLLRNAAEVSVGVLSPEEALKLLLASAEISEEDIEEGSDEHKIATEIVELCGRLPLTLAVAGGMLADSGQGFTEDILEAMKDKQELEDEDGMTIETRVISTSERVMVKSAGKHKNLIGKVFRFFAVFPEDVPVPASFFNKMVPLLTDDKNEKKSRLAVGTCLGTLLKYNLLKGSLSAGSGVFMHDIVRDYVIHQRSTEELRMLQQSVVDAVLAARPEPKGFPPSVRAVPGSFEGYLSRQLFWHMRQALEEEEGEEPPDAWLAHPDIVIIANAAMAVGLDTLEALSASREASGELLRAAQTSWAASWIKSIDQAKYSDLIYRAADLLEQGSLQGDPQALRLENEVLSVAFLLDVGSERNIKSQARSKFLGASGKATFASLAALALASFSDAFANMNFFGTVEKANIEGGLAAVVEHNRLYIEAGKLSEDPTWRDIIPNLIHPLGLSAWLVSSPLPQWDPAQFGSSEETFISALDDYEYHVHGSTFKESSMRQDYFRCGHVVSILAFWYGNRDAIVLWHSKTHAAFDEISLPTSGAYKEEVPEVGNLCYNALPSMIMVGLLEEASSILAVLGFTWDQEGFERIDKYTTVLNVGLPFTRPQTERVVCRLLAFLSSAPNTIDVAQVNSWMPTPKELADMEKDYPIALRYGTYDVTSFGARAFLKLGRDDDAYELSRIAVSPEQKTEKKTTLVACYCILGEVAAKRSDVEEAESHFANALQEAKLSRLPMMEVIAARGWKMHLLEPEGRGCGAADAVIDGACAKMKKTREQVESGFNSGRRL